MSGLQYLKTQIEPFRLALFNSEKGHEMLRLKKNKIVFLKVTICSESLTSSFKDFIFFLKISEISHKRLENR